MIKTHEEANAILKELILTVTTTDQLLKIAELAENIKINGAISISKTETVCNFDYMRVNKKANSIEFIATPDGKEATFCYAICYTLNMIDVERISTKLFESTLCEITVALPENETVVFALNTP